MFSNGNKNDYLLQSMTAGSLQPMDITKMWTSA